MNIVIIIPAYKEHESIHVLFSSILQVLPSAYIVVVDDSPDDRTQNVVNKFQLKNKRIHLIKRDKKAGRGSAVIEGMRYALKHISGLTHVVEMDADGSHDPKELLAGITAVRTKTAIVASRYIKGSKIIDWPLSRKALSRLSNFFIRAILGSPLHDNTNGYRFYSRKAAEALTAHAFISTGFVLLTEEMLVLTRAGYTFREIPTVFKNRALGTSSANWKEFTSSILTLWKLKNMWGSKI